MPDLTDLQSVKMWLGGNALQNTTADGLLGVLITSTSADFLRAIGRTDLLTQTYTETREGDGSVRLVLHHWPITAVTTLKVGTATVSAQGNTTDGWYLDTGADPERAFVVYLSGALRFQDAAKVTVTYVAGYPDTPEDIAQAVTEWVAFRYVRKNTTGQSAARSVEGEQATFSQMSIPENTQRVIAAYKRKFAAYGTDAADTGIGNATEGAGKPMVKGR